MTVDVSVQVCCDIIVESGGKILLGKRGREVFGRGTWAVPGGHLEVGEKMEDCVARELNEELGVVPSEMKLLGVVNHIPDILGQAKHYVRFVYLITKFSGEITNKEPDRCEGWVWFNKKNLPEPVFVGHVKVLDFYLSKRDRFFME